jgi:hypothetical protein
MDDPKGLDRYQNQWPRVGGVLGMAIGSATALAAPKMKRTQVLSATNLLALIVHPILGVPGPGVWPRTDEPPDAQALPEFSK